jgi:hypothetical protein
MQAKGAAVQRPEVGSDEPRDFRTFYDDEQRRLFQALYFEAAPDGWMTRP